MNKSGRYLDKSMSYLYIRGRYTSLKPTAWVDKVLCTSTISRIGCHAQGNINITQDVVRAISILPSCPCAYVSHTNHVKTTVSRHCFFVKKWLGRTTIFLCGLATESLVDWQCLTATQIIVAIFVTSSEWLALLRCTTAICTNPIAHAVRSSYSHTPGSKSSITWITEYSTQPS